MEPMNATALADAEQIRERLRFLEVVSGGHPAIVRARREVEESLSYMLRDLADAAGAGAAV